MNRPARLLSSPTPELIRIESGKEEPRFRYFELVLVAYVTVLLCSNLIGPGKSVRLALFGIPVVFGAGNLFFPISYIIDDVMTEVYGYARARRATWAGFFALIFAGVMGWSVIHLPADPNEPFNKVLQPAIETVFGSGPRIIAASIIAFWVGDFANALVMAKMKIWTRGQKLWTRTIGSTIVSEGFDSLIFYPIAFAGIWTSSTLVRVLLANWGMKVVVEIVATPLTYRVVHFLKRREGIEFFDSNTNFTPFSLKT
jgi:uncharacterized integral membrane protein (TIGR00697 family)